jgi:hypothetical protein
MQTPKAAQKAKGNALKIFAGEKNFSFVRRIFAFRKGETAENSAPVEKYFTF